MTIEPRYEKNGTRFALYFGNDCLYETDEIAIAFDEDGWVLLKHGDYDLVNQWFLTAKLKYRTDGFPDMANNLRLISSSKWDPEILTKIVTYTGYLERFLEGIDASDYRETRAESTSC